MIPNCSEPLNGVFSDPGQVNTNTECEGMDDMSKQSVLEKLKEGARKFQSEVYARNVQHYQRAASTPQAPHTLIIGCADSRVDLEAITSSGPGEIFVARNVGNMVPPYSGTPGGVTAVIEYAVAALKVSHVVVCGHSDCGAMKALLHPPATDDLPTVRYWLHHGEAALRVAGSMAHKGDPQPEKLKRLTEENVLMQLVHLKTHPSVAGAMARGELTMSGWVFDIGSGVVRIAEEGRREFVPVTAAAMTAA
jgi:carbonic anhydrase